MSSHYIGNYLRTTHIHKLRPIKEPPYKYECVKCGTKLQRLSGVLMKSDKTYTLVMKVREFDHILAALRVYQTMLEMGSAVCQDVAMIATDHGEQMTPAEIDTLIERLFV